MDIFAPINNLAVDRDARANGLGRKLIETVLNSSDPVTYILRSDPENRSFYDHLEFVPDNIQEEKDLKIFNQKPIKK